MKEFTRPVWRRQSTTLGPYHDPTVQIIWSLTWGDTRTRVTRSHIRVQIAADFGFWVRVTARIRGHRMHEFRIWEEQPHDRRGFWLKPLNWIIDACAVQFNFLEDRYTEEWERSHDYNDARYGHP